MAFPQIEWWVPFLLIKPAFLWFVVAKRPIACLCS